MGNYNLHLLDIYAGTDGHEQTVAIAYHLQRLPYVFPIIGGRKVEQLHENIEALEISLTAEQIKRIEDAKPFDPGFPHAMIVGLFLLAYALYAIIVLTCLWIRVMVPMIISSPCLLHTTTAFRCSRQLPPRSSSEHLGGRVVNWVFRLPNHSIV